MLRALREQLELMALLEPLELMALLEQLELMVLPEQLELMAPLALTARRVRLAQTEGLTRKWHPGLI